MYVGKSCVTWPRHKLNSSLPTYNLQPSVLPLHAIPLGRDALHCRGDVDLTGGGECMSGHVPRADMYRSVRFASAVFQGSHVRVSSLPAHVVRLTHCCSVGG